MDTRKITGRQAEFGVAVSGEAHPPAPAPTTGRARQLVARTFDSLSSRNYRLLFQGVLLTQIGFWMQQVAMGWLVLELTNSPFYLGLAGFARAMPMLVISPFGGVLADRFNRKITLIGTQFTMMTVIATVTVLIITDRIAVEHLLLASFLHGAMIALNNPARQALLSDIVTKDQLPNAIALNSMSVNGSRIVGPTLAGIIMAAVGAAGCFAFQTAGYVWAVLNVSRMRIPARQKPARAATVVQNLVEGLRYCYQTRLIFTQILVAAVPTVFAMSYYQLLPAFARDVLGMGPGGLGLLFSAMGSGALLGTLGLAATRPRRRGVLLLTSLLLFGATLCLLALTRSAPLALVCLALAGGSNGVYTALNSTIIQEAAPDELRGRVMSVYFVTFGLTPLGALPAGAVAEFYGAPTAIFAGGAVALLFSLWLLAFRPQLRTL